MIQIGAIGAAGVVGQRSADVVRDFGREGWKLCAINCTRDNGRTLAHEYHLNIRSILNNLYIKYLTSIHWVIAIGSKTEVFRCMYAVKIMILAIASSHRYEMGRTSDAHALAGGDKPSANSAPP